mmetsp:Transcript_27992/g.56702  ORF Transcript_27992/g.56702 Transcript_27992/m.56702 type:complete len:89 (-) Transcript_27992:94-360(-)
MYSLGKATKAAKRDRRRGGLTVGLVLIGSDCEEGPAYSLASPCFEHPLNLFSSNGESNATTAATTRWQSRNQKPTCNERKQASPDDVF